MEDPEYLQLWDQDTLNLYHTVRILESPSLDHYVFAETPELFDPQELYTLNIMKLYIQNPTLIIVAHGELERICQFKYLKDALEETRKTCKDPHFFPVNYDSHFEADKDMMDFYKELKK